MEKLKGYAGNILRINLTTGNVTRTPTADYADLYIGGRGLAAKIYWDENPPEIDAYDPESRLLFVTGPVTGVAPPFGSRWQVCGKSPIHNKFSFCNLGGAWGAQLKFAGYDGLVVHGKSDKPVYLQIQDDEIEIKEADHLVGKGAVACREGLKDELGKSFRMILIFPKPG